MRILILLISFIFIFQVAWSQTKTNKESKPQAVSMERISTTHQKANAVKKVETPENKLISKKIKVRGEKKEKTPENKHISKETHVENKKTESPISPELKKQQ